MRKSFPARLPLFGAVGILYLVGVIPAILYSWGRGIHLYDMGLTVSLYVGLHTWTAIVFFLCITAICVLLSLLIWKTPIGWIPRVTYQLCFLCTFGCACFPCNHERSMLSSDIHDLFSYGLVILVALSFLWLTIFARGPVTRGFGVGGLLFSGVFIFAFAVGVRAFKDTILIWENLLIILLFLELFAEDLQAARSRTVSRSEKETEHEEA